MKYLLPLLLMFNVAPKEPPERLTFEVHPNYIIEEMQHVDDNEVDNNESIEIINNILNK